MISMALLEDAYYSGQTILKDIIFLDGRMIG